jgi:bleomycin hydrolase
VPLNLPYNFSNEPFYNLPLDEFVHNIDQAINQGYSVAVELDVSEPTFSGGYGMAVIPDSEADNKAILIDPKPEKNITQAYRQQEFENFHTTNDHNVHIVGWVKDQTGKLYYKAKNSWSNKWGKEGYVYMSAAYLRLKVLYVTLHRDSLLPQTKQVLKL